MAVDTCLSPTGVSITSMPASRIATWKPWFDITVTTTASPASRPASFSPVASTVRIWSPSSGCPSASTARHRSASPS